MVGFTGVLAHQGGWDELLLVAAPIVVFVVLLRIANARAAHLGEGATGAPAEPAGHPSMPGAGPDADGPPTAEGGHREPGPPP